MLSWSVSRVRRSLPLTEARCRRQYARRPTQDDKEFGYRISNHDEAVAQSESAVEVVHGAEEDGDAEPLDVDNDSAEPDLKPDDVLPPFADAFTTIEGDVRTHRSRRYGNKALPLSPFIDPIFVAARNRWKMKKAPPPSPEEMTPFQKKLYANAYAHALATPVRASNATDTRLPSFFLLPLSLRRSPDPPHTPTWVPSTLWSTSSSSSSTSPTQTRQGPQAYIDLSAGVLNLLTRQNQRIRDLANQAYQQHFVGNTRREMVLRPQLQDFVLELLRRAVLKSLRWLFKHPGTGLVSPCPDGASNVAPEMVAVLYLTPVYRAEVDFISRRVAHEILEAEIFGRRAQGMQRHVHGRIGDTKIPDVKAPAPLQNPAAVYPEVRYPLTWTGDGVPVPVYTLFELLGEEKVAELVGGTAFEGVGCVLLRGGDVRSLKAQMALLRLLTFILQEGSSRDRTSRRASKEGSDDQKQQQQGDDEIGGEAETDASEQDAEKKDLGKDFDVV